VRLPLLSLVLASTAALGAMAAEVTGVILDVQGLPVPGARITLSGPHGHNGHSVQSDVSGRFLIPAVQPGEYALTVRAVGLSEYRRPLQVTQMPVALRLTLEVAPRSDSVTVEESGQIDLASDATTQPAQFSQADLEGLPIKNGDVIQALSLLLNPAAGGSATIIVDGVERPDATLTPAMIRSIKIGGNPYSAEYSGSGKARIEIETRGAADRWHGSLTTRSRNSRFDARNPLAASRLPFSRQGYEASLAGPLARGLGIFLLANWEAQREDIPILALLPDGSRPGNFLAPSARGVFAGRLDWQFHPAHRVMLRYELKYDQARWQGAGGLVLQEHGLDRLHRDYRIEIHHQAVLSPHTINTARLSLGTNFDRTTPVLNAPAIHVAGAFVGGGAQRAAWRRDPRVELLDVLASERGRVSSRMGFDIRYHPFDRYMAQNTNGTWQFGSLAEYLAGRAVSFLLAEGNPLVHPHQTEYAWFFQREIRWKRLALFSGVRHEFQSGLRRYAYLAPRLSLAWSPQEGTVLRAGAGAFYEHRKPDLLEQTLRWDGANMREFLLLSPSYPALGVAPALGALNKWQLDSGQRLPLMLQTSVSAERKLNRWAAISADFTFQRGLRLYRVVNLNEMPSGSEQPPRPGFGNVNQIETSAASRNWIASVSLQLKATKQVQLRAQYSYSRLRDDTAGPFTLPASSLDLRPEWGPSLHDQPHRLATVSTARLRWKIDFATVVSLRSGPPYSALSGVDTNRDGLLTDRPSGVRRNTERGTPLFTIDLQIARAFSRQFGDRKIEVRAAADSFNTLNRANYTSWNGFVNSGRFGQAVGAAPGRQMQGSLTFRF